MMNLEAFRPARHAAAWALLGALVLAAPGLRAQVLYGSLTGTVTDSSGAAVPNVKVEAVNTGTGVVRVATTESTGSYSFNDLQGGSYKITFSAPAFRTTIQ